MVFIVIITIIVIIIVRLTNGLFCQRLVRERRIAPSIYQWQLSLTPNERPDHVYIDHHDDDHHYEDHDECGDGDEGDNNDGNFHGPECRKGEQCEEVRVQRAPRDFKFDKLRYCSIFIIFVPTISCVHLQAS